MIDLSNQKILLKNLKVLQEKEEQETSGKN